MGKKDFDIAVMEEQAKAMTELNFLNKKNAEFFVSDGGFVGMRHNGNEWERVRVIRLFPFSSPDEYISVRTAEEHSKELGVIKNIKDVTDEAAVIIKQQLNLHYFTPVITKVIDIKDEYGYAYFHVMTDRGECRFTINMGANAVVRLSDTRLLITDLDENRFEIPDVLQLTNKEQRKLDLFL
ncbi:MAG: DUF1854 domain-containing protein [Lachnospiraceae bacterium]|nr:DUF1854 domain-containing protein [Lachnospiraceae bacterium]